MTELSPAAARRTWTRTPARQLPIGETAILLTPSRHRN